MKNWAIFQPFISLYYALFNDERGFSYRKLGATFALYTAAKISFTITVEDTRFYLVITWIAFGAVCIGLVTIPDLIKFLSEKTSFKETVTKETEVK